MKIKKSKTLSAGDLISLKKDKLCRVRKDTKKGPDGIYFPKSNQTIMDMDGKIKNVEISEHVKLKGMIILQVE